MTHTNWIRRKSIAIKLLSIFAFLCLLFGESRAHAAIGGAILPGFDENTLPANDDGSTGLVPFGFTVNFYGNSYSGIYINNNGNATFNAPQSVYTPYPLTSTDNAIIAPFFADVDTRGLASGLVMYSGTMDTLDGHPAFGVDFINVGYFYAATDKLDSFQMILIDRSDTGPGNFDLEFNYDQIQWETGDASDGVDGLGGYSARVGFASGMGESFELPGSGVNGAFLDTNQVTGLIYDSINSGGVLGRYIFPFRNGQPVNLPPIVSTGPLQNAVPGETVTLDASQSSDPQGLPLTFQWLQTGGTPVTLSNTNQSITTFVAPSTSGTLSFQVNVSDGQATTAGAAAVVVSTVATKPATQVTGESAQLNGSLYAGGIDAHVYFQYGTDTTYGSTTPVQDGGSGTTAVPFSAQISDLTDNTTYHYQAVGVNTSGTFYGIDEVFTASDIILPIAVTDPATGVTLTSGTLNATVNPQGEETTVYFEYGTNNFYGETTDSVDIGSGTNPVPVAQFLGELNSDSTYHYRVVATNDSGTVRGGDQFFTTVAVNPPIIGVQQPAGTPLTSNTSVVNFPVAEVGVPQQLKFTVINSGSTNLTTLADNVSGGDASLFTAGAPGKTTLASGSATTFTVTFAPTASGTFTTTLQVTSNDPATPSFNIGLSGNAVVEGFFPVSLSSIANDQIEHAIKIPNPPVGAVTLGGIPFNIPGPYGTTNIWNGNVAESGDNEATVTVPVNMADITEVHFLMNSFWGQPGTHAHIDLMFDTGTYTKDLYGDVDIRDYQNFKFTNHINGTTTVQVFTGESMLDDVPGRIDKMIIPVPQEFQGGTLLGVKVTDDGHPNFQRVLLMGLTVRIGSGITVEEPAGTTLYSDVNTVDFGPEKIGGKVPLQFTVTNGGATMLKDLKTKVTNDDGPEFTASPKDLPNLAPGQSTTFTATYAPGIIGPQTATLQVTSSDPSIPSFDIALSGTGESPTPQAGTYMGLLEGSTGVVTIKLDANKSFTGTLLINGKTYQFRGTLNASGIFTVNVGSPPLTVSLQLNTSGNGAVPSDYTLTGSAGDTTVTAYHDAYATGEVVAEAGTYTVLLLPGEDDNSVPQGTGYATLTVDNTGGGLRMTGKLADGTAFTTSGDLVSNGMGSNQFILFDPSINKGKGLLAGTVTFESLGYSDCDGTVEWMKPASTKTSYYKAGFNTYLGFFGSLYAAPAHGDLALALTSGVFELSGGGLSNLIEDPVTLLPNNTVTVTDSANVHLKLKLDPSTGMFSGSFIPPSTTKAVTFGGVLYQDEAEAEGFFLGPVTSGTGLSGNAELSAP